jgi:hypothetical protein
MREFFLTKIGTEAHKFTISKYTNNLQFTSSFKIQHNFFNNSNPFINKGILDDSF